MKKLTTNDGVNILIDVIKNNRRHRDYERVTKIADKMKSLITGENMDSLMRRFDRRESEKMFEQRKEITCHVTSTVCQSLIEPEYKIPRSNGVRRILKYMDDNENTMLGNFNEILGKFWGDNSLDKYLNTRWIDLTNLDPNSFIVFEWDEFNNKRERANPYPFEVSSHEAVYYQFENNLLQYLVVMNEYETGVGGIPEKIQPKDEKIPPNSLSSEILKKYTIYFKGYSIVFQQLSVNANPPMPPVDYDKFEGESGYVDISGKIYEVSTYQSKLKDIPALRVGFRYDPVTRGRTCVPPIWNAVPILMKTVKSNSELDLTMALHVHAQRLQYVPECPNDKCTGGRLPDGKTVCGVCKGSGTAEVPTSAQEMIKLKMPRDKEEMLPLDDIVKYVTPDVALVEFLAKYIERLSAQCKEAVYNSEIFSRQQIAETATGKNIDLQNVYDALYPMAEAFSYMWEKSIGLIADITQMRKGLIFSYTFSKDFKMKSMSELIMDLKTAADSRADGFVKQGIQTDIAQIMYTDDPIAFSRYMSKERFNPYSGKSREEVATIVALAPRNDFHVILWEMYGYIFEELEREFAKKKINFYELTYDKQWKAIEKKVNAKIKERADAEPRLELDEEQG